MCLSASQVASHSSYLFHEHLYISIPSDFLPPSPFILEKLMVLLGVVGPYEIMFSFNFYCLSHQGSPGVGG